MYAANDERYVLFVLNDDDPINPRKDCDPFGKMVCWHRRYSLGDEHEYQTPEDFLRDIVMTAYKDRPISVFDYVKSGKADGVRLEYDRSCRKWVLSERYSFGGEAKWYQTASYGKGMDCKRISDDAFYDIVHALSKTSLSDLIDSLDDFVILPLYLFDHSGITMNTRGFSCPWDSGQVGWIYADRDAIVNEYGKATSETVKKAEVLLEAEVKSYDLYLTGECYGYRLYEDGVEVDSCWGFLGELSDMEQALRGTLSTECKHLVDKLEFTDESEDRYLRARVVA